MAERSPFDPVHGSSARLRFLESVVGSVNDAILVTEAEPIDEPGPKIVFVNKSFTRTTGYAPEEVIGKTPRILQGPKTDRARLDEVWTSLSRQEQVRVELLNYRNDGTEFWVEINTVPVADESGKTTHFVSVQREVTGRKQTEEELRESEERLRAVLVQYGKDIITIIEADGTIRYESPAVETTLGYRPEELVAAQAFDYIHPDDVERMVGEFAELLNGREASALLEFRFRHADGSWRWLEATGSNLLEDPGLRGIVVNSRDVTERRQAESTLRESERRLVEAQRVAQIGNWDWQVFTDTIVWSEELYRIYGVAPGEFGGTYEDVLEIAHPEDKEHVAKTVGTAYENLSKFRFDHRRVHPDRGLRVLTVRGDVVAGESGEPIRMFGTVQDVTDRKQAENELKGSHDLLQSVMEGTTDAVFVKDLRGRYLMIKRAGAEALGKSVEEIIGKDDIELFSEEDGQEVIEADQEVLAAGETRTTEDTKAAEGQMTRTFLSTKGPYRDGEGNVAGMFGVARDITDRKRYEEALRRSEGSLAAAQRMARVGNLDQVIGGDLYWADELYRIYGFTPKQFVPTYEDAMSVIHPDDKEYIEKTQEEVRRSGEKLQVECRIVRPDGEVQIVQNSFEMDYDETGDLMRIAGTVQDITGRKWEERRRAAHHEVTRVLAETSTLEDAAPKILQAICENLEWEVGEFWNVDWEAGVLRCIQTWNGPNIDVSEFIEATRQTTFSRGEGMPGRIWESGEPAWISDVWDVDNLPRMPIALKAGLRGGFGFPILLGGNVFGVMDFFCPEVRQPDKEVLDMMTAIGSQIGQFIERKNFESQLQHQALHDDPTDLPNRNLFTDRLQHALERAKRRKKSVAVLFLDLDNFKYINDTLGHDTGDQLLAAAAECLKECLRPEDTAARLGGDEFAVLLEEIPEPGEAELVAERILNALSRPFDLENHRQFTNVSIGIVVKNGSDHESGELLRSADLAMYKAKTTGKNRYALFDLETERRSMQRLEVENDLRASLERDEFRVLYQPQRPDKLSGWKHWCAGSIREEGW